MGAENRRHDCGADPDENYAGVSNPENDTLFGLCIDELPQQLFKRKGAEIKEADAMMRGEDFWNQYRQVPLTETESSMDVLVKRLEQMPGFKYVIFVLKAFVENFVETGTKDHPSKVDIGPVNTMISNNYIDGLRLRMSAQTTANLNPHLFFKGYYAYGFKDHRSKYMAEMEYSFNKRNTCRASSRKIPSL